MRIIACRCGLAIAFVAFAASSRVQGGAGQPDTARVLADIQRVESALPNIADRGAALYLLARRYASAGDRERALAMLTECLSLNEGFEPDTAALQTLQPFPAIRTIVDRFRQSHPPVHRARVAFTVPETDLFPEGLAFDGDKRVFYLSSEYHNKIVKVDANHDVSDFVSPDRYQLSPVGGLRVDPVDHTLWAATDSAEFVHVDAKGQLLDRFSAPEPGPHILNDLVVRRSSRDIYVTDTRAHLVYRFDRRARTFAPLTFHRPLFYPNGIALSPDERLLFVADLMGVIVVDLRTGNTHDVRPDGSDTLAGIDGLYWHENGLIGVQYGTGAYRVMRWRLSRDTRRAVASDVLEYRTDLVSFPTTGAIVADDFYFIANTGIGNLQDGHIVDRTKLEPVHVAVVNLR